MYLLDAQCRIFPGTTHKYVVNFILIITRATAFVRNFSYVKNMFMSNLGHGFPSLAELRSSFTFE